MSTCSSGTIVTSNKYRENLTERIKELLEEIAHPKADHWGLRRTIVVNMKLYSDLYGLAALKRMVGREVAGRYGF